MALNIKDPETDRLARELAQRLGTSITDAIKTALIEHLQRNQPRLEVGFHQLQAIIDRGRARPMLDDRSEAEILGYDHRGIPS